MDSRIWIAAIVLVLGGCERGVTLQTRTFELEHLHAANARELIAPYVYDRPDAPGALSDASDGAISVRETPDNLAQIERMLQQLDRPQPTVRLFFQLIEANGHGEADPAIAAVETELRELFKFTGYRLVAEVVAIGIAGSGLQQTLYDQSPPRSTSTREFLINGQIRNVGYGESAHAIVALELLSSTGSLFFTAEVSLEMGKTTVLGTGNLPDGRGLILAMRAERVE